MNNKLDKFKMAIIENRNSSELYVKIYVNGSVISSYAIFLGKGGYVFGAINDNSAAEFLSNKQQITTSFIQYRDNYSIFKISGISELWVDIFGFSSTDIAFSFTAEGF